MGLLETESPMDDGKPNPLSKEPSNLIGFVFTFGSGHHHGPEKESLNRCYTTIWADSEAKARVTMHQKRQDKWSFCYHPDKICTSGMIYVSFNDLKPQDGPTR